jgi:predicted CXXCH cytochrome family protein
MNSPPAGRMPGTSASAAPPRSRAGGRVLWRLLGLAGFLAAAVAVVGLSGRLGSWKKAPPPEADPFPLPPLASSPFRNTRAEVGYVGSDACRACHVGADASYRRTGMGRSMAEADPAREPPDAVFDHPASQRRYQVLRKGGRLWHRELLLAGQPEEVVLCEYPLKYVVGSGRHSLTYLVEAEGFLVESPVTWYSAKQAWGMSPGYDKPHQVGFERAADEGCLICHAGQAEAVGGSSHRMHVAEAAIGCERCHGPGALHVERYAGGGRPAAAPDDTIVNPARLARELAEAVCQQCHLRSSATVVARRRDPAAFRPGLPLQDFRHDYRLEVPDAPMTVVGHVEQMHLSRCYQGSDTLSCLTCHNPHGEPRPRDRVDYYNSICLDCHRPERCTVAADRRQRESPDNDCVHCHMPRSPTEIPHLAFTHHRIGIHARPPAAGAKVDEFAHGPGVLRPFLELTGLSDLDRKRSLGLGYLETANRQPDAARATVYGKRALESLTEVRAAGLPDPAVDVALARLRFDMELGDYLPYAAGALSYPELAGPDRCTALFLVADTQALQGRHAEAAVALRQLVRLRRHSVDWLLLADCERALGHSQASLDALHNAVRINPRLWKVHRNLAQHYRQQGDLERAAWHERRAAPGPAG